MVVAVAVAAATVVVADVTVAVAAATIVVATVRKTAKS